MVSRESLKRVAQTAESLGYDYIAPNDRVVHPVTVKTAYPYTDSGKVGAHWLKKDGVVIANSLELLTSIAFLAGCRRAHRLDDDDPGAAVPATRPGGQDARDH